MPRKRSAYVADNVRIKHGRYHASVMVNRERRHESWDLSTPLATVTAWVAQQTGSRATGALTGSIAADVAHYLPTRIAAPSYRQIVAFLDLWLDALGRDRASLSVTHHEINLVLERWLKAGLAPATVQKRRYTLQTFFEYVRSEDALNPVWKAKNPAPVKPDDRSLDYGVLDRVFQHMPTWRHVKRGTPRQPSKAKLRAAVIAYTGIPPGLLAKVKPIHLKLAGDDPTVEVAPRRKGGGTARVKVQLSAEGVAAYKDFHAGNAYGGFAATSLNVSFKRAAIRAGLFEEIPRPDGTTRRKATVHLYDLRHSFAAALYEATKDLATVARALCHAPGSRQTQRYAMGANKAVDRAAATAVSAVFSAARRATLKVVARAGASEEQTG